MFLLLGEDMGEIFQVYPGESEMASQYRLTKKQTSKE